jgi:membrane protease YdiL (CAAX protease family)
MTAGKKDAAPTTAAARKKPTPRKGPAPARKKAAGGPAKATRRKPSRPASAPAALVATGRSVRLPEAPAAKPERRPRDAVIAIVVAVGGSAAVGIALALSAATWSRPVAVILLELPPAVAVAALVTKWRWWRRVGWHAPSGNLWLLWFPLLLVLVPVAITVQAAPGATRLLAATVAVLMIGFTEEMWFRGVLLEALLPRGTRSAVIVSAALFGAAHIFNVSIFGAGAFVQAVSAFGIGLLYGASRVRIRSLWPFVLLHAAMDIPFIATDGGSGVPDTSTILAIVPGLVVLVGCAFAYAFVLTRGMEAPPRDTPSTKRTNGNAIASLFLGIGGFVFPIFASIPAVILGYRSKSQIERSQGTESGGGLATAGIVLGFVTIGFIGVAFAVGMIWGAIDEAGFGAAAHGRTAVSVERLSVGACYDRADDYDTVYRANCRGDHDGRVLWRGSMPSASGRFPGDDPADKWAHDKCVAELTRFVTAQRNYGYDPDWFPPDGDAWDRGDHNVTCVAEQY